MTQSWFMTLPPVWLYGYTNDCKSRKMTHSGMGYDTFMTFICFVVGGHYRGVTINSPGNGDVVMQILIKWYHTKVFSWLQIILWHFVTFVTLSHCDKSCNSPGVGDIVTPLKIGRSLETTPLKIKFLFCSFDPKQSSEVKSLVNSRAAPISDGPKVTVLKSD